MHLAEHVRDFRTARIVLPCALEGRFRGGEFRPLPKRRTDPKVEVGDLGGRVGGSQVGIVRERFIREVTIEI